MGIAQRGLLREDRADRGRHIRVPLIALVLLPSLPSVSQALGTIVRTKLCLLRNMDLQLSVLLCVARPSFCCE